MQVINDSRDSVMVKGQEEIIVRTAADIFGLLDRGNKKRQTAATLINAQVCGLPLASSPACHARLAGTHPASPALLPDGDLPAASSGGP